MRAISHRSTQDMIWTGLCACLSMVLISQGNKSCTQSPHYYLLISVLKLKCFLHVNYVTGLYNSLFKLSSILICRKT